MPSNFKDIGQLGGLTLLALILFSAFSSQAQPEPGQRGFWCDVASGQPITMYQNSQGGQESWIVWESNYFAASGWDPLTRCEAVSTRLEDYRLARSLEFITWGRMNNQNIICTAAEPGGPCQGLIFTLKPEEDPDTTLQNFLAWREGSVGLPPLFESAGQPRLYLDVREHVEYEPEGSESGMTPSTLPAIPERPTRDTPREL